MNVAAAEADGLWVVGGAWCSTPAVIMIIIGSVAASRPFRTPFRRPGTWWAVSLLQERMQHPAHHGRLEDATGVGAVGNPACGDVVTLHIRCEPPTEDGEVVAASFESMGSAYQLATASVLVDCVVGGTAHQARERTPDCVLKRLPDLPRNKRYLARLALEALGRALDDQARRARPGEPDREPLTPLSPDAARGLVLDLLGNGRKWGTREIDAMARADGHCFPGPTVRFLADLRADGVIDGAIDAGAQSWRWWRPDAAGDKEADGAGDAPQEEP